MKNLTWLFYFVHRGVEIQEVSCHVSLADG
jgi:hypothetical protein